ncbi:MAG: prephenate dehydrogenase/arogenate dehydrogenase family protein [Acidobacteriota bacterium]
MKIEEVGLVGFGRFGKMAYDYLRRDKKVRVYNHNPDKIQDIPERATLEETLSAQLILLCVPISGMEGFCKQMAPFLKEGQIVVDTCSVKVKPVEWMLSLLPETVEILGSHPLFGPDSGKQGIAGLKIALCPARIQEDTYRSICGYLEGLQLVVIEETPEGHDSQIAKSQAIFHLIAQAMKRLDWGSQAISTPGPDAFYRLVKSVQHDTDQLFLDMERENPYAAQWREEFIRKLESLDAELSEAAEQQALLNK